MPPDPYTQHADVIEAALSYACRMHRLTTDACEEFGSWARLKIIGSSTQIARVVEQARRVAAVPRPVLIVGERGTGKELVARAIHLAASCQRCSDVSSILSARLLLRSHFHPPAFTRTQQSASAAKRAK